MQQAGQDGTAPPVVAEATAEEEALKRNTDCVYFLASPLTCKKGVECEYRHSEGARVNPRDCRYWLNGNCLNPKCLFRHPPLDGLIRTSSTQHSGATSTRLPVSYSYHPAAHYQNKQNVPCYYFQKGACLKGDLCSFMHAPESMKASSSVKQQAPMVSSTHESTPPPLTLKASPGHDTFAKQKFPAVKYDSSVDVARFSGEPAIKAQSPPSSVLLQKHNTSPDIECSKSQTNNVPVSSGIEPNRPLNHHSEVLNDDLQDNGEGDEFLHESSPGFDVLVDGHTENPMYFHNEGDFHETSVHDVGLNTASDFVNLHASDDDTTVKHESWQFNEMDEYGQYMGVHDCYRRRHHDFSPERHGRMPVSNRRRSRVEETPTEFGASDLRHRLQKKRMLNSSRSSISPDKRELYRNDGRYVERCRSEDYNSCREQRVPREVPISKRLQGRITLPTRSTTERRGGDFHFRQDIGRGRNKGRISPGRLTDYHGRLHDRINLRWHNEDFSLEERKPAVVRSIQRDEIIPDFAGPKSLSELKVHKSSSNTGQGSVDGGGSILSREEKYMKLGRPLGHQEAQSCSFEGPKPLSMILKRKRELLDCAKPGNGDELDDHEVGQASIVTAATATSAMHVHVGRSFDSEQEDGDNHKNTKEPENRVVEMQGRQHHVQSSSQEEACDMEGDEIQHMENQEFEEYDQGDGEFEYEVVEGEEFKAEEYENACPDNEEYLEEEGNEEGDEKFGVLFS